MNNNRQIAKQKFDEHFMFKDNPIAWTAWKMAFQLGIEHQQALHKTDCSTQLSADSSTEDEYCKCEHPTLGKSVSRCGTCDRWFKPIA